MSSRARPRLPVVVGACCLVAIATALLIPPTRYSELLITALFSLFAAAYVVVGAVVSTRRPENPVGWLMLGIGVLMSLPLVLGAYAGYALLRSTSLPFGAAAAWLTSWLYVPALAGIVLLVLVFPSGRTTGRFRTWVARVVVVAAATTTVATALVPGPMDGFGEVQNPVALTSVADPLRLVATVGSGVLVAVFALALVSIFVRVRGAHGDERQQLKWLAYATVAWLVTQGIQALPQFDDSLLGLFAVVFSLTAFPAAIAVAILRYRLYDIDVLISRTLVYGALTLLLGSAYLLLVLGLRPLLQPLTGESDLAVAASTLAVAALFRPARATVQGIVDRRFYRRRYDAGRTVEAFAGRLRQEVDLDAVSGDLRRVAGETMQPTHLSLWLRRPEPTR